VCGRRRIERRFIHDEAVSVAHLGFRQERTRCGIDRH
jgi:hypothetical protein